MEDRAATEVLRERMDLLRESMHKSQSINNDMAMILTSFDNRLTALDDAMYPVKMRTYAADRIDYNVGRSLKLVETIVFQLDRVQQAERVILNRASEGLRAFLDVVDQLRSIEYFFTSKRSYRASDEVLKRVNGLLSKAAVELENEFHRQLSKCSKPVELERLFNSLSSSHQQSSGSSENQSYSQINPSAKASSEDQLNVEAAYTLPTLIDPRFVPLLSMLVQKLVQSGRHQQCLQIYREVRGSTLELSLKNLGVEYVKKEEMQAESLDGEIVQWIHFFRIAVKLLFADERRLCSQIFKSDHTLKDHCFAEATEKSLSTLLSFGEAVAKTLTSPEKLFVLLDMYEAMLELRPEIEAIFEGNACSENRKSVLGLTKCLAKTAKTAFSDFKDNIVKDSPKSTNTDGSVHPVTSYVINYIKFLFDYQSSLKHLFEESNTGDETSYDMVSRIKDVIQALETNLNAKSKKFKDPALGYVFLMNNIHYIVRSICRSEAKDLLGDDWIQRRRRIVQQHATQYRRVAWGRVWSPIWKKTTVLECLSAQGLSSGSFPTEGNQGSVGTVGSNISTTSRSVIKERLRSFNMQFEEVCQTQLNWAIPDTELRDTVILMIAEILFPAYRSFLKHFGPLVENSHNSSKYIKYSPETLEQAIGDLFVKKL